MREEIYIVVRIHIYTHACNTHPILLTKREENLIPNQRARKTSQIYKKPIHQYSPNTTSPPPPSHQQPPNPQQQRRSTRANPNQPLQRRKLDTLQQPPQIPYLFLNPTIRLLNLQFMNTTLLPNPSLLQIQVQPHTTLSALHFLAQSCIKPRYLRCESLLVCSQRLQFPRMNSRQLRAELRKINLFC